MEGEVLKLEEKAVPVHFPGMVAHWPALKLWKGESGLQRLVQLAGAAQVEAMVSPAADGRAVGDMQHLVLLGCSLAEFLDGSLERKLLEHRPQGSEGELRLYLAQSPVCAAAATVAPSSSEGGSSSSTSGSTPMQPAALHPLMEDLGMPWLLQGTQLSQINFWASLRETRSSLHYDPYQNLLCVVRARKRVWLLPPACTPHLSPQPLTHESANHSPADLARPNVERFPGLPAALGRLQEFELAAGDALFIPNGWWHQVDSEEGTLAVNFWWEGATSRQLGGHMDRFYLRRLLQSLLEKQKQAALAALPRCDVLELAAEAGPAGMAASSEEGQPLPQQLGPPEQAAALQLLAAAVAEHQQAGSGSPPPAVVGAVVATLAGLSAQALLSVLLRLRRLRPQLAAHLLLHSLGPAGWELLSGCIERRQEELAAAGSAAAAEEGVSATCDAVYSAVQDRQQLVEVILRRKQEFAQQALRAVLETELGGAL